MRLRYLIFATIHLVALFVICIFKFFNPPVKTEIVRTSIMSKQEKDELISGVLSVLSTNSPSVSSSAIIETVRPVEGYIYFANGIYIYRNSSGFDFYVGDVCPYDFQPILAIYKQCFQTSGGSFIVGSSSSFSSSPSSSPSSSSAFSISDKGVKL